MAQPANFKALLTKNLDDIKKPTALPAGSYRGVIRGHTFDSSARKGTPFVRFEVILSEALDGVDQEDLALALASKPLAERKFRKDYFLTEDALYRCKDMLTSLGIETAGRTLDETIPETTRQEVLVELSLRPSEDGKDNYNDISDMKGVGE